MKHATFPCTRERTVDELLFHWSAVIQRAETDFARGFAKSIAGQSRRRGWKPTPKQLPIMQSMVADLFRESGNEEDDFDLIES